MICKFVTPPVSSTRLHTSDNSFKNDASALHPMAVKKILRVVKSKYFHHFIGV